MYTGMQNLVLENCKIIHRNFEGRPTKFNKVGGVKSFSVVIEPENVENLINLGWHVVEKFSKNDENRENPYYTMDVKVNYKSKRTPEIYVCTSKKKTKLDEETVKTIDYADIVDCSMILHPFKYDENSNVTAYLDVLYVTINDNVLADKFDYLPLDGADDETNIY